MHPISARVSARAREHDGLRPLPTAAAPARDAVQVGGDRAPRRVARGCQEGGRTRDSRDRRDRSSDKAGEVTRRTPRAGLRRVRTAGRAPECQARSPTVAGCEPAGPRTARCRIRRSTEPDGDAPCHEPAGPRTARSRTAPPRTRRPKEPGGDAPGHRIAGSPGSRGAAPGAASTTPDRMTNVAANPPPRAPTSRLSATSLTSRLSATPLTSRLPATPLTNCSRSPRAARPRGPSRGTGTGTGRGTQMTAGAAVHGVTVAQPGEAGLAGPCRPARPRSVLGHRRVTGPGPPRRPGPAARPEACVRHAVRDAGASHGVRHAGLSPWVRVSQATNRALVPAGRFCWVSAWVLVMAMPSRLCSAL